MTVQELIDELIKVEDKSKEVKEFLSRLKTFKNKACDERVTILTVYNRVRKGVYQTIEIDGVKFIVEDKK